MVNDVDLDALGGSLRRVADDLQRSGEQLQQAIETAQARSYEARSRDGLIEVAVDVWVPESRPLRLTWGSVGRYLPG